MSAAIISLALMGGCSKTDTNTISTSSPTATPAASPIESPSPTSTPAITPSPTGSPFADVQLRLRDLESKLDNIFSDSFRDFDTVFGPSAFGSSVDLREQKDRYVARIYPPGGDTAKVNARIEDGNLHITIEGKNAAENYDQIIGLPQPVRTDQMQIDRKSNFVVVTIPKSTPAVAAATPSTSPTATVSASPFIASNDFDQRMMDDMSRMEARMDEVFRDAFPSDLLNSANIQRLGSSVNVEDQKDKYVVHFRLPHRDIGNVDVKFENGRLHLVAQEEKQTSNNTNSGTMQSTERGRYEEMVAVPGPVKDSEMKVERNGASIDVTLPKG